MSYTSLNAQFVNENTASLAPYLPDWLANSGLNAGPLAVYLHLCRLAYPSGTSHASQSYVAKLLGLKRETVGKYLAQLEELGYVLIDREAGRCDYITPIRPHSARTHQGMAFIRDARSEVREPLQGEPVYLMRDPTHTPHNIYGDDLSGGVEESDTPDQITESSSDFDSKSSPKIGQPLVRKSDSPDQKNSVPVGKIDTKRSTPSKLIIRERVQVALDVRQVEDEYPFRRDVASIAQRMSAHYNALGKSHMVTVERLRQWVETERNPRFKTDVPLCDRVIPQWRQLWLQVFEVMPRDSHTWQYLATVYPEDARKVWEAYEERKEKEA